MVEILAELFKATPAADIDKVTYLLQGRVAPLYEPIEFGMADKMVIKAMAKAYDSPETEITKLFKKAGDLGFVAENLGKKSRAELSVSQVFEKLSLIAQTGGAGSVEKKVAILSELLKDSDSLSAKYIARTPVDKLRLGFSDMTVLDALSWFIDHTKSHKVKIEAAYNIRPDLGYIAKQIKESGLSGLSHVKPKVGTPILVMRAERLTTPEDILEKTGGTAAVEPKLDGLRTQLHKSKEGIELFSRGLENVTAMYPDLVAAAQKEVPSHEVILDGEAIGFDPETGKYLPFQETVQRKRKYDIATFSKDVPLQLVVFDVLYKEGENYLDKPYSSRRQIVEKLLKGNKIIVAAKMETVTKPDELQAIFLDAVKKNLEGIMAKKISGVYEAGARGWNWIKYKKSYAQKLADTVDAVVMGYDFGQGKRNKFGVGSFLIGVYDPKSDSYKTISKVGTGLTDEEWRQLVKSGEKLVAKEKPANYDINKLMNCDVWLKPKLVGEFTADELTKSPMHTAGYALRFPRLSRWREKNPEDTTTLKEILALAKLS